MRPNSATCLAAMLPLILMLAWCAELAWAAKPAADTAGARELGRIDSDLLNEVSGIAASRQNPGILWMHNDGDAHELFAVDTSGRVAAVVRLAAPVVDTEDIAIGPGPKQGVDYLYLGDIGDNDENRRDIRVLRFAEPKLGPGSGGKLVAQGIEQLKLVYPNKKSYNAEALLVDSSTGDLFVVTKEKKRARVFSAPGDSLRNGATAELELVADPTKLSVVSGGDIARDGSQILLRRENRGWLWDRQPGESVGDALARRPREVPVRTRGQSANGESVAFHPEGDGYYTVSEGSRELIGQFPPPPPAASKGG